LNNEWIKNLKSGDKVAIREWCRSRAKCPWMILIVERITPQGKIRLSNGYLYKLDGIKTGDYSQTLFPVTQEIEDAILKEGLIYQIGDFDKFKNSLSLKQIQTILEWKQNIEKEKNNE
jgi:hypothetical protein